MLYLLIRCGEPVDPFGKPLVYVVKASSEEEAIQYTYDFIEKIGASDETADKNGIDFRICPLIEENEEDGVTMAVRLPNPLLEYTDSLVSKGE